MHVSVVIFAGGTGMRMNSKVPKQFLEVDGKPIIIHTLEFFEKNENVDDIVVVCKEDWIDYLKEKLSVFSITKVISVISGGKTGQLSRYYGIKELEKRLSTLDDTIVMMHDGVRPLINDDLINRNIQTVRENGNSVTIAPAIETVITIEEGTIQNVIERAKCRMAKAPQCFWMKDILAVHDEAFAKGDIDNIDTASIMSKYGHKIYVTEGPTENIKITTPLDFYTFKAIYEARKEGRG
jgi:2-C-methyl-D-erythritol 4-phosphate cytidylyltransferase